MLSPTTQNLIEEFFAGKTCCRCGGEAVRFRKKGFYCQNCYRSSAALTVRTVKTTKIKKTYKE